MDSKPEGEKSISAIDISVIPEESRILEILAANLRRLRLDAGLTQAELGWRVGMKRTYISAIERGLHAVGIDLVERLASELGVEAPTLLILPIKPREMNIRQVLAHNLKQLRGTAGLSQQELGRRSGVEKTYICAIEMSRHSVRIDLLAKLAAELGVSVPILLRSPLVEGSLRDN